MDVRSIYSRNIDWIGSTSCVYFYFISLRDIDAIFAEFEAEPIYIMHIWAKTDLCDIKYGDIFLYVCIPTRTNSREANSYEKYLHTRDIAESITMLYLFKSNFEIYFENSLRKERVFFNIFDTIYLNLTRLHNCVFYKKKLIFLNVFKLFYLI